MVLIAGINYSAISPGIITQPIVVFVCSNFLVVNPTAIVPAIGTNILAKSCRLPRPLASASKWDKVAGLQGDIFIYNNL